MTFRVLSVLVAASCLGCGGGDSAEDVSPLPREQVPETAAREPKGSQPGQVVVEEESGFCDFVSLEEVDAAFEGKLPLGAVHNINYGCVVEVRLGDREGNAVRFGPLSRQNYEAYKQYEGQTGVAFEWLEGLGQEAFVINHNQLQILAEDGQPFIIALQLVLTGIPMPLTHEEIQKGVIAVGRLALERRSQG